MPPHHDAPATTPEDAFLHFLESSVRCGLKHQSWEAFRTWMDGRGAGQLFAAFPDQPPPAEQRERIALAMALGLWNMLPLPRNGYRPEPVTRPRGEEPCLCGSGHRAGACCGELAPPVEVPSEMLWAAVVAQLPQREIERLARQRLLPPVVLGAVARDLLDHDRPAKVAGLLAPLLEHPEALDARHEEAIDALLDAYDALDQAEEKTQALKLLAERTRPEVRVPVLLRECSIALDEGDPDAARHLFETAQRLDPDHAQLGVTEALILLTTGETRQAQERARFWVARLRRAHADEEEGPLPFLREIAEDPERALVRHDHVAEPDLAERLLDLADAAARRPVVAPAHRAAANDVLVVLRATGIVAAVEQRWQELWEQEAPELTELSAPPTEGFEVWDPDTADLWLTLVEETPEALDSFTILDGLAQAVMYFGSFPTPWVDRRLLAPFVERSQRLLAAAIEPAPGARVPWEQAANRPALRGAARLLDLRLRQRDRGAALELARWLLRLNPGDHHGFRGLLANELLARGEAAGLLELSAAYPEDRLVEVAFGRVAALFLAGRPGDALVALTAVHADLPRVGPMLLADDPKPPRPKDLESEGLVRGGVEEAWIYRREAGAAWRSHPELWRWFGAALPGLGGAGRAQFRRPPSRPERSRK